MYIFSCTGFVLIVVLHPRSHAISSWLHLILNSIFQGFGENDCFTLVLCSFKKKKKRKLNSIQQGHKTVIILFLFCTRCMYRKNMFYWCLWIQPGFSSTTHTDTATGFLDQGHFWLTWVLVDCIPLLLVQIGSTVWVLQVCSSFIPFDSISILNLCSFYENFVLLPNWEPQGCDNSEYL